MKSKLHNGNMKASLSNAVVLTGSILVTLNKNHVQKDQGPQHRIAYAKSNGREDGNSLKLIETGNIFFLNRTSMVQVQRSTIVK